MGNFESNKSKVLGEKVYVDISYVMRASLGKSKYWVLMVDQASRQKWCAFIPSKDESNEAVIRMVK